QTQDVMSSPPRRRFLSGAVDDPETVGAVVSEIESGLYRRLSMQVRSVRLREEARLWFARGDPVQQIADRTATDIRIVYQRRTTLCQLLGTRPRELPLSLTVEWGNHIASDVL
ncbi:MAG: hypothetical protein RSD49_17330, partial [Hafnia sp.]